MKLCSRLLIVFGRNVCKKRQIWASEAHFRKVRSDYDFGWWLIGKPVVDFLFALIEFFCYLLRFRSYEAKYVRFGCFQRGSTSLHSNFTGTTILGIRKLETLDYPMVKTASFCVPLFWHNTGSQYHRFMHRLHSAKTNESLRNVDQLSVSDPTWIITPPR